jgi:hypothetical protein
VSAGANVDPRVAIVPGTCSQPSPGRAIAWRSVAAALALAGPFIYFAWHALTMIERGRLGDFPHFYYAAAAMRSGDDIYASWQQGYLYPPLWAFLVTPLTALSLERAAAVQVILNSIAGMTALFLCSREAQRRLVGEASLWLVLVGALLCLVVLNNSVRAEIEMGQTNSWVLLAIVLSLCALDRFPWASGVLLGMAFNIKFQTVAFLPYLLLRRRWAAAASFIVGIVLWSLVPMLATGWSTGMHNLAVAYSGVLDLVGVHTGLGVAAKNPMDAAFSISITSAMARLVGPGREASALVLAAGVLGTSVLAAFSIYRRSGVPFLCWPGAGRQSQPELRGVTALEWAGMVVVALVFSPQTNTRHFVLLALPASIGAALILKAPRERRLALVALVILACGLMLPPGGETMREAVWFWRGIGGQSWCILLCYGLLLGAGMRHLSGGSVEACSNTMYTPNLHGSGGIATGPVKR